MAVLYDSSNETLMNREQLHAVRTPPPMGRYHRPIPFGDFAEAVVSRVERAGLLLEAEEYAVSKDGMKMFGVLEVGLDGLNTSGWALQIGLRGSHDQSLPRGLTLGSRVLVCSNLCFHGELGVFNTRQTLKVQERLPELIARAVSQVPALANRNVQRFDQYRTTALSPRDGDATLVELLRRGALSPPQLERARMEWDEPSFAEHAEDGFTVWRLFNACTQALKPTGERVNHELVRTRSLLLSDCLDEALA